MYKIHATYNGVDPVPNEIDLYHVFEMLKDSPEDFLRVNENDEIEVELDIDGLTKLFMTNSRAAAREFNFHSTYQDGRVSYRNLPEHLCGTYRIQNCYSDNPLYSFEQWSIG